MRLEKSAGSGESIQNACDSQVRPKIGQPIFVIDSAQLAGLCPKRGEPLERDLIAQIGKCFSFVASVKFLQEMR